ncbi:hypothetical protein [Weizmannia phage Youna2]
MVKRTKTGRRDMRYKSNREFLQAKKSRIVKTPEEMAKPKIQGPIITKGSSL